MIIQTVMDLVVDRLHCNGVAVDHMSRYEVYTEFGPCDKYGVVVTAGPETTVALVVRDRSAAPPEAMSGRVSLGHPRALELIEQYVDRAVYVQLNYRGHVSQHHRFDTLYERILADEQLKRLGLC